MRLVLLLLLAGAGLVASQEVPNDEAVVKSDRERYSNALKASLLGQLDVIHAGLGALLTFEKHEADAALPLMKIVGGIENNPETARTPEDRLLRELKAASNTPTEEYNQGMNRPGGGVMKAAPRTLDPGYEAAEKIQVAMGVKPKPPPVSLFNGRLSSESHFSTEDPGLIMAGNADAVQKQLRNTERKINHGKKTQKGLGKARKTTPAAEEVALGLPEHDQVNVAPVVSSGDAAAQASVIAATLSADAGSAAALGLTDLFEFYSASLKDHFYTIDGTVDKENGNADHWGSRRTVARVFSKQVSGTVPLYLFWNAEALDHMYSRNAVAKKGYRNDGVAAFVYPEHVPGTVPLFEFFDARSVDHIYTTDKNSIAVTQAGPVQMTAIVGYVLPSSSAPMSQTSLLDTISQLSEDTDVLAELNPKRKNKAKLTGGWPPKAATVSIDGSMMDKLEDDPKNDVTTQIETQTPDAPVSPSGVTQRSNEATEGSTAQEPQPYPEISEGERPAADTAVTYNPPPNQLTFDITPPDTPIPKIVPMYEYYNPLIKDHYYTTKYTLLADGKADWELVGPKFYLFDAQEPNTVPLYKYWNLGKGDHYYTLEQFTSTAYRYTGIAGYVYPREIKETVPLYRYFSPTAMDHLYTLLREDDRQAALGYQYQGIQCYVFDQPHDQLVPQDYKADPGTLVNLYRYFNSKTLHHFYTTSTSELAGDQLLHGWNSEGVVGRIHLYPMSGLVPLRRFWNVRTLNHYYTTRWIPSEDGWTYDGIQGYVNTKLVTGSLPLYRYYNAHTEDDLYTTDENEMKQRNDRDDWILKGITCYVYSVEEEAPVNVHRYFNPKTADYFYTTSFEVFGKGKDGWIYQGTPFAAYNSGVRGTVPVHAYYHPINFDHLYTTNFFPNRKDGWVYHGVAYYAYSDDFNGESIKLYRFFNPTLHTHYYTTELTEATLSRPGVYNIAQQDGWFFYGVTCYVEHPIDDERPRGDEVEVHGFYNKVTQMSAYSLDDKFAPKDMSPRGVVFKAWGKKGASVRPVFRYYNKDTGLNSYDTRVLTGELLSGGGNYDGPAFYVAIRAEAGSVPLYRFTADDGSKTSLSINPEDNNGWKLAGIAGFVIPAVELDIASNAMNIYQYFSPERKEHFYTANWNLLKDGAEGWVLEGVPFRAHIYKGRNRVPIYDHYDAAAKEHTFSSQPTAVGDSRTSVIAFYLDKKAADGQDMAPLLTFVNDVTDDHIYAVDSSQFKKGSDGTLEFNGVEGWREDKSEVLGYAYKPSKKMADVPVPNGSSPVFVSHHDGEADELHIAKPEGNASPAFYAFPASKDGLVPLYSYYNSKDGDRLYTTKWFQATEPWTGGEVAFYVLAKATDGAVPLYRFRNIQTNQHVFSITLSGFTENKPADGKNSNELAAEEKTYTRIGSVGEYTYEGVQCYVFPPPQPRVPIHVLFEASSNRHMYTADVTYLRDGWRDQGAAFWAYTNQYPDTVPMLEYINSATGTRELADVQFKTLAPGFVQSPKPVFYVFPNNKKSGVMPLHRYYNANLKDNVYVIDQTVFVPDSTKGLWTYNDNNTEGWKYEGISGYVFKNAGDNEEPN